MERQAEIEKKHHHELMATDWFMRIPVVLATLGENRTGLYAGIKCGKYPKPIKLAGGRSSAWVASEINQTVELMKKGLSWADRDVSA